MKNTTLILVTLLSVMVSGCAKLSGLQLEVAKGNSDKVAQLISAGAPVDEEDPFWGSTLTIASNKGRLSEIRLLVDHGADVNQLDNRGTPLHSALNAETVSLLVSLGADVTATDSEGRIPLYTAIRAGRTSAVAALSGSPSIDVNDHALDLEKAVAHATASCHLETISYVFTRKIVKPTRSYAPEKCRDEYKAILARFDLISPE